MDLQDLVSPSKMEDQQPKGLAMEVGEGPAGKDMIETVTPLKFYPHHGNPDDAAVADSASLDGPANGQDAHNGEEPTDSNQESAQLSNDSEGEKMDEQDEEGEGEMMDFAAAGAAGGPADIAGATCEDEPPAALDFTQAPDAVSYDASLSIEFLEACSFLLLFGNHIGIPSLSLDALDTELSKPECSAVLMDLHVRLLRTCGYSIPDTAK